jgi:hypothetical protein
MFERIVQASQQPFLMSYQDQACEMSVLISNMASTIRISDLLHVTLIFSLVSAVAHESMHDPRYG